MTNLEALMQDAPAMTLSVRTLDDGRHAAMIEVDTGTQLRIGWGVGQTVEDAVVDALLCVAEHRREA